MRTRINLHLCRLAVAFVWAAFVIQCGYAQGTAFSYEGQLLSNGQPANGNYDITFTLFAYSQYGFPVGPVLTNLDTPVSGGLFSATLNFGAVFNGSNYWLEIAVRTNGNGYFTILEPRQLVTPVPYAVFSATASNAVAALSAASVPAGGIVGTIPTGSLGSNVALLTASGTLPTNVLPASVPLLGTNGVLSSNVLPVGFLSSGNISWQVPSTTAVQAQPNSGYLVTNSEQVTITLPATPNVGDVVEIAGRSFGEWLLAQNAGQMIAASFTPVVLPGDASGYWNSIASSSDGTRIAAVSPGGYGIWTSSNFGTNWAQTSAPTNLSWRSIASSSDGTKLAAAAWDSGIWTSSDSGTSWVQTGAPTFSTNLNIVWSSIASSSDGTRLVAVNGGGLGGGIWTSSNSGTNWVQTSAPTNAGWYAIASSSDGTKLAAVSPDGYGIWTSSNSGTNWGQTSASTQNAAWQSIAMSADGTKLAVVASGGGIWTSSNFGTNWMETSAPSANWSCIASSSDGTELAAVDNGGGVWVSSDSGTNWAQANASSPLLFSIISSLGWTCIASSSDGTKVVAGVSSGGIWTFVDGVLSHQTAAASGATTVGTAGFLQGNFGTVVELVYAGEGQFIALYQTGSLSGH